MKRAFNISLGEKTIQGLRAESEKLDMSVSALITMLYQNYIKEQTTLEMINNKELMKIIEEVINKELNKI